MCGLYAVLHVCTRLEELAMHTPEKFEMTARAWHTAFTEFTEALQLARLPARLTAQLNEPLKEHTVRHLLTQWLSLYPPDTLIQALFRAGWAKQREGKDAEEVFGPYNALVVQFTKRTTGVYDHGGDG